jgi:hypothetical protein
MKFRWKYFIALLMVSLIPLATVTWISQKSGEIFGKDRLKEIIQTNASSTAKETIAAIYDALNKFRGTK